MKITLIKPPNLIPAFNLISIKTPPLGAAFIASALIAEGHIVELIDGLGGDIDNQYQFANDCFVFGMSFENILAKVDVNTNVIAFSLGFSFEWPLYRDLIIYLKKYFPDTLFIAGGEHITAAPEFTMRNCPVDICILGEGEETIVELINSIDKGIKNLEFINGISFIKNNLYFQTSKRERIRELNSIHRPAWHLVPLENYLKNGYGHGAERGRSMPILASRGCPYQCTFCSNPSMWTTRWNIRTPEDVIEEMIDMIKIYKVDNFDFYDLTAIVKKNWIVRFCNLLIEKNIDITWQLPSGTRSEAIDEEVAELLFKSGCRNLSYAPESGSIRILKLIKKKIDLNKMIVSMYQVRKKGLILKVNIIIGFPQEKLSDIYYTWLFSIRMAWAGVYDYSVFTFSPYPGTELFNYLSEKGRIELNDDFFNSLRSYADVTRTYSFCENMGPHTLKYLRYLLTITFYAASFLRYPLRPFRMVRNILNGGMLESRTEKGIFSILSRFGLVKKLKF